MGKARREPQLFPVRGGELDCDVATKGWRPRPNVHAYIQNATARAADQLALGMRRDLIMKTAQDATCT